MRNARWIAMLSITALSGAALAPSSAFGAWPMARHDAHRVGAASGTSNLVAPVAYWRQYLGGAITNTQFMAADATGTGSLDFILANDGLVAAVSPTGQQIWKSPLLGVELLVGIRDLDGDGVPDVVARSGDRAIVLSLRTGALEWEEPVGEMGSIGSLRLGDTTGDGKPDLLVTECGCCGVNSGNSGFYWSFGGGFTTLTSAGSIPSSTFTCSTAGSVTLLQADATPGLETLLAGDTQFALLDGTGHILSQTGAIGSRNAESVCTAADIDGAPGSEIICLLNSGDAPATNQRRISVLHYDYLAQPPALEVVWSKVVAPDSGGDMTWVDPVQDLAGDGTFEVIAATKDPSNGWQTHIYDAMTGSDAVAPMAGQIVAGTAAMESKASRLLLTQDGTSLSAWAFVRTPTPGVTLRWTIPNASALKYTDLNLWAVQSIADTVTSTDLNGDGLADLVALVLSGSTSTVTGFSGAGGKSQQIGQDSLPPQVDLLESWVVPSLSTSAPQIAIARSDGILNLLDGQLHTTSAGTPPSEVDVRFGGFYASGSWNDLYKTPRLFAFSGGKAESVLVADSRTALLSLDVSGASLAIAPIVDWQATHTFAPTIVPNLDGSNPGVACLALTEPVSNPPTYRVRALHADGSTIWDKALSGIPLNDLAPGQFNGDSIPDFALQLGDTSDVNLSTLAISGADGAQLWATAPVFPGGGGTQSSGMSIADWNGDGVDDVHYQGAGTFVLSGVDGSALESGGTPNAYSLPLLYDTTGSGQYDIVLNAGYWPVSVYSHDLQTARWASTDDDRPYPYGAIASCPGTPATSILVEGSLQNPARLKFTSMSAPTLGTFTTIVLAGGGEYSTEAAAVAAGNFLGQLSSANIHQNLTGASRPSAVVGSSDGWLYAVNPCDGTLDFSVQIGSPVGEVVFGDTDGDGLDEIVVSAADGYVYGLKNNAIAAPSYVWDTDPDRGITDHDVDTIVTTSKLSGTWSPVTGAASYQVEVVTTDGKAVSKPLWQTVASGTSTSLTGLSLEDDTTYIFAVRAVGPNGVSVDAMSNGVTVHFPGDAGQDASAPTSDGGAVVDGGASSSDAGTGSAGGGGCACRESPAGGSSPPTTWWLLVPLAVLARRSRRVHGGARATAGGRER